MVKATETVTLCGRIVGHELKHPEKDEEGNIVGLGPLTVKAKLEYPGGSPVCKAEILVERERGRDFPIGGYVDMTLTLTQQEMELGTRPRAAAAH